MVAAGRVYQRGSVGIVACWILPVEIARGVYRCGNVGMFAGLRTRRFPLRSQTRMEDAGGVYRPGNVCMAACLHTRGIPLHSPTRMEAAGGVCRHGNVGMVACLQSWVMPVQSQLSCQQQGYSKATSESARRDCTCSSHSLSARKRRSLSGVLLL